MLFVDYLKNHKQRVVIKGQYPSWENIHAGVPQGSVLGSLLLLVYINDLVQCITCNKSFADDTILYFIVLSDDLHVSSDTLNQNLNYVTEWAQR